MGSTATVFMAINCYIGWWYQRLIRHRFIDVVKSMYMPPPDAPLPDRDESPGDEQGDEAALLLGGNHGDAEERQAQDEEDLGHQGRNEAIVENIRLDDLLLRSVNQRPLN